jgi:hypothetical protein
MGKKGPPRLKPPAPKRAAKASSSKKCHPATLLEEHEDEQEALLPELMAASGATELEMAAMRAIRDNFKNWSVETTHMKIVEGKR